MALTQLVLMRFARAILPAALLVASGAASAKRAHAAPEATTWYVSTGGNDGNPCTSTGQPCRTLQTAINKAAAGDTIHIAEGTYTFTVDQCGNGVNAVACVAEKNLVIRGGFDGATWSGPNLTANPTVIDGSGQHRGFAVLGLGSPPVVTIEHLIFRNGRGGPLNSEPLDAFGGGMLVNIGTVVLRNVEFRDNKSVGNPSGGGRGGKGVGGGLAIRGSPGQNVLHNVVFSGNQALGATGPERGGEGLGGGLFTYQSQISASGLSVTDNLAQGGNSGGNGTTGDQMEADGLGGGMAFQIGTVATVQSSTFRNNTARGGNAGQNGGNAFGGGLYGELAAISVVGCDFRQNTAVAGDASGTGGLGGGGAISHNSTSMTLERSFVIDNDSAGGNAGTAGPAGGGGIYIARFRDDAPNGGTNTIINSIIAANATRQGNGGQAGGGGGGLWVQGLPLHLTHVTIAGNTIANGMLGSAMIINNFGTPQASTVNLNHTVVANHGGTAIEVLGGNTLNLNRGLWAANGSNTGGGGSIGGGGSMVSAASAGFVSPGAPNYNYRLASGSAAVDQATNSSTPVDVDGQSRPLGPAHDIGADELNPPPLVNGRPWAYLPITSR
jgi:hypothetical protein